MERNFTDENFERFLQEQTDNLRMPPSDKVWNGISQNLNRGRRRLGFLIAFSLLVSTGFGYYLISETPAGSAYRPATKEQSSPELRNSPVEEKGIPSSASPRPAQSQAPVATLDRPAYLKPIIGGLLESKPAEEESSTFNSTVVDSYDEIPLAAVNQARKESSSSPINPLTIESVVNSYLPSGKGYQGLQFYFTPTVSYRKLNDDNVDNVVTHKPDFGFELGLAAKYALNSRLRLRGGLQFNVNRYSIKTYSASTEIATIRLNSRRGPNYVNTATNYNNFTGYKSNWIENYYFQVSAPVGVELKLRGDDKVQFGVATTLQPTYVLGDRAYVISTDYKNYAEVPKLTRHWNLNSSVETYVAYSTGHLNWQVGPQVRYQLLSSFVKTYPVKENLFDFGLKVGVGLNH